MNLSRLALGLLAAAIAAAPLPAAADLVTSVGAAEVAIGGSGTFDVFADAIVQPEVLTGYTFAFDVTGPGPNPFTFTGVSITTNPIRAPQGYILPGSIGPTIQPPPAGDDLLYLDLLAAGDVTTTVGSSYGAGRVAFTVAANATPGVYAISFETQRSGYFLNQSGDPVPSNRLTFLPGSITVIDPAAIPEPSTTLLLGLAGIGGFAVRRLRRKQNETPA